MQRANYMRLVSAVICVLWCTAFLALSACSGVPPSADVPQIPPPADVAAAPADAVRTSTNLASKVIMPGKGSRHPRPNSTVTVHYTGWTTDGKTFDTPFSPAHPPPFPLDHATPASPARAPTL